MYEYRITPKTALKFLNNNDIILQDKIDNAQASKLYESSNKDEQNLIDNCL